MKVLLVSFGRVIESKGGTEKVFFELGNELLSRGNDVLLLSFDNKDGSPLFRIDDGVNFLNIRNNKPNLLLRCFFEIIKVFNKRYARRFKECYLDKVKSGFIQNQVDIFNPDVIVSFMPRVTRAIKFYTKVSVPVVTMFHLEPRFILDNQSYEDRLALNRSELVQVLLPDYVAQLRSFHIYSNIIYLPNAVLSSKFSPDFKLVSNNNNTRLKKVITVGRVEKVQKRTHLLIHAFAMVDSNIRINWTVEVYGEFVDYEYKKLCISMINKLGLNDCFFLCGITNDVSKKLSQADIFAFPSAYEGMPLAMLEAMSVGLPVLGFKNCIGVSRIIHNNLNGLLAENNIDDFASNLELLIKDDELRSKLGIGAIKSVSPFDSNLIYDKWNTVLKSVSKKCSVPESYLDI